MKRYSPKQIEPKWQAIWDETGVYTADLTSDKPKFVAMSMFNYPSGAGIHIGHAMNYTISDVKARFKRQQGHESYHPVGWDAFGLPAENYAIKAGVSPQESMATIIPSYHKQYKAMGWSNDWEKEIATHLPEYYKWTQWIFAQMYKHGLAYQDSRMQWWCDKDKTVLANEQVIDGKCWRHDGPDDPLVKKREVKQWFFKITEYADELLEAIDDLDWTESVKLAQKNWIGKSVGAEVIFKIVNSKDEIKVYTTRIDTIFGVTFLVLAPEHPLLEQLTTSDNKTKIDQYLKQVTTKSDIERQETNRDKTGVFTGSYAINPATNEKIPIWVADYVLAGYGTGAVMAVPGHDQRDRDFALKFDLPVISVIEPVYGQPKGDDIDKDKIIAVVYNPKNNKVIVLDWGPRQDRFGGNMLVGGSVEGSEDIIETAKREIQEETGYTDLKFIKQLDARGHGYFYSNVKNKNYHGHCTGMLFELNSDKQSALNLDKGEENKFKLTWVDKDKVASMLDDGIHETFYRQLVLGESYEGEGIIINSQKYDGLSSSIVREKITVDLSQQKLAKEAVNYKMRDWSVSRQRYWGAPIPIINCPKCGPVLVPDEDLPVVLPELDDFQPSGDGRSALARAKDWLVVDCPKCSGIAERETDTLDTYICSSWYMYRYLDPHNQAKIFDSKLVNKWAPIDFYNGGDHATAHLLYARFVARFFNKIGLVDNPEPFKQMLFNGKVMAADGSAFSKSKGNGVDPLEIIESGYGADALRTYLMFAAPLDLITRWDPKGVPGAYRFLSRVWNLVDEYDNSPVRELEDETVRKIYRSTHSMIKKVSKDLEQNRYNTAIASAMACTNELYKLKIHNLSKNDVWHHALSDLVACIAPFAPHISEELWHQLGHSSSVHKDSWPTYNSDYLERDEITIVVQINGKLRSEIQVPVDATETLVIDSAKADAKTESYLKDQTIKKTIYVKSKLINFVI
ncbi:MAG TPA: class I tRNA ligase family protein [Candidatus Saccharimonadales bacterium]|nr:class I tRNA ligase family protein [Candidatus Saccharimonadales bacterium]